MPYTCHKLDPRAFGPSLASLSTVAAHSRRKGQISTGIFRVEFSSHLLVIVFRVLSLLSIESLASSLTFTFQSTVTFRKSFAKFCTNKQVAWNKEEWEKVRMKNSVFHFIARIISFFCSVTISFFLFFFPFFGCLLFQRQNIPSLVFHCWNAFYFSRWVLRRF